MYVVTCRNLPLGIYETLREATRAIDLSFKIVVPAVVGCCHQRYNTEMGVVVVQAVRFPSEAKMF